ncbi:MAG: transposase [Kiritimatiellae bacterium]|jgi:putative transposase|nr:transposase [Kiritimatiellia bacterium]
MNNTDKHSNKNWSSRGYLPHYDNVHLVQSITFRLADSLPQNMLEQLEIELRQIPLNKQNIVKREKIEEWLDAGMGCCALRHPSLAAVVQEAIKKFDGERYDLFAWCVMPNHVHMLLQPKMELGKIVQSIKSFTGRWALSHNAELELGVPRGRPFWMREYWDRYMRDMNHFKKVDEYINNNPVKAGLCVRASDWKWSSAKFVGWKEGE